MKPEKIVELLVELGIRNANRHKRAGWVVSACPLGPWHHEGGKSSPEVFGVKIEEGDPQANCFACAWHGTAGDLVQRMIGLNKIMPRIEVKWKKANELVWEAEATQEFDFDIPGVEELLAMKPEGLMEFPAWWLGGFPRAWDVGWARAYLMARHVSKGLSALLDVRCDPSQRRVCFPVRDFDGVMRGMHGRATDPEMEPRYRAYRHAGKMNPIVWMGEDWVDRNRPIVVVEGPFDLMSVKRVYANVVTPLYATPSHEKLMRMADALDWITFFDRGAGGDNGRLRVDKALSADHVVTHLQPPKGRKDPGEMGVNELAEILSPFVQTNALFP
jgi:hypothetical protein